MIQNECDKKEKIVKQLYMSQGKVTELVEAGYTVTIRPVKEGKIKELNVCVLKEISNTEFMFKIPVGQTGRKLTAYLH